MSEFKPRQVGFPGRDLVPVTQSYMGTGDIEQVHPTPNAELRLIMALADGKLDSPKKTEALARELGWSKEFLQSRVMRKDIRDQVVERIRMRALQAVANALESQAESAKTDIQAYKTMLHTAEVLQQGSGSQVNVAIDARKVGDTDSDRKFFESYHRRIEPTAIIKDETQ